MQCLRLAMVACFLILSGVRLTAWAETPTPASVIKVQEGLHQLGYLGKKPSGKWDEPTKTAITRFADQLGMPARVLGFGEELQVLQRVLEAQILKSGNPQSVFISPNSPRELQNSFYISGDGSIALTMSQSSVVVWNVAAARPVRILYGHCCVSAMDLSRDGTLAAVISGGGLLRLFDVRSGQLKQVFALGKNSKGEEREATSAKFLPSNDAILIGDGTGSISLLSLATGKLRLIGNHVSPTEEGSFDNEIETVAVSNDGKLAATLTKFDGTLKIWKVKSGQLKLKVKLFKKPEEPFDGSIDDYHQSQFLLSFGPKGTSILVGAIRSTVEGTLFDPVLQTVDVETGKMVPSPLVVGHFVTDHAGNQIVTTGFRQKALATYLTDSFEKIGELKNDWIIKAIDDDGKAALIQVPRYSDADSGEFGFAQMSGEQVKTTSSLIAHVLKGFAINEESQTAYLGIFDGKLAAVDLKTGKVSYTVLSWPVEAGDKPKNPEFMYGIEYFDHRVIDLPIFWLPMTNAEEDLQKGLSIDPETGKVDRKLISTDTPFEEGYLATVGVGISPDGKFAVTGYQTKAESEDANALLSIIDTATGKEIARHPFFPQTKGVVGVNCFWFGPETCKLRGLQTTNELVKKYFGTVTDIAFSGQGRFVFTGYWEPAISAIDVESGEVALVYDTSLTYDEFGLDEKVGTPNDKKGIWDVEVAENGARSASVPIRLLPVPGKDDFFAILNSDFGNRAFMLGFSAGLPSPALKFEIPGSTNIGTISADGSTIALGYDGGIIFILNATTGVIEKTLYGGQGGLNSLRFSADGKTLYASDAGKTNGGITISENPASGFHIWDIASESLISTTTLFEKEEWITHRPDGYFASSENSPSKLIISGGGIDTLSTDEVIKKFLRPDLVETGLMKVKN